jgi:preprotein translocase, SecE subunit, bacterial
MNTNRRWIGMAYLVFGVLLWIIVSKFLSTMMQWTGIGDYNFQLLGDQFTLTTFIGFVTALSLGIWAYRHPTLSTLSEEVVVELKKVTWPTRAETRAATIVVIITVFILSFFLGMFDLVWSKMLSFIYPHIQSG